MVEELIKAFAHTPFSLSRQQAQTLERFHTRLMEVNRTMNLTAVTSFDQAIGLHYIDSAAPLFCGWIPGGSRCVDVGAGAGFPGIVLAILQPNCTFVLMDSLQKRIRFLADIIQELSLTNATALHIRAEDAGQDPLHREQYDIVLSRAVAPMPVLCEYCLPLAKIDGCMLAFKGPGAEDETQAASHAMHVLGAGDYEIADARIPGRRHKLIRVVKARATPKAYPRKAGMPAKAPLY